MLVGPHLVSPRLAQSWIYGFANRKRLSGMGDLASALVKARLLTGERDEEKKIGPAQAVRTAESPQVQEKTLRTSIEDAKQRERSIARAMNWR